MKKDPTMISGKMTMGKYLVFTKKTLCGGKYNWEMLYEIQVLYWSIYRCAIGLLEREILLVDFRFF